MQLPPLPQGCDRECLLERVGTEAKVIAGDVAAALTAKLDGVVAPRRGADPGAASVPGAIAAPITGPTVEACGGLPTAYIVRLNGFSAQEVQAAEEYMAAFRCYEHHRPVRAGTSAAEYWYETRSDSARLGRNLRLMLEHMSAPARCSSPATPSCSAESRRAERLALNSRRFRNGILPAPRRRPAPSRRQPAPGGPRPPRLARPRREAVFPTAGSVGLVPPPGMTPSKGFAGFEHRSGASILITEMPAEAYGQLVERFTPEALRATGFEARSSGIALGVAGGEGRVLRGSQAANGITYAKWVAVVRGASVPASSPCRCRKPQGGKCRTRWSRRRSRRLRSGRPAASPTRSRPCPIPSATSRASGRCAR